MTKSRGILKTPRRRWTPADDALIRARYPDTRTEDLARALGRSITTTYQRAQTLGLHKSAEYLASPAACRTNGRQGMGTRFVKGQMPPNKGLRRPGWAPGRMRETQFRKGERRGVAVQLYKPIGTERLSKEGYLVRKVNDGLPLQKRWRAVHLIEWEKVHGPLPPGHALAFKNRDRTDIRLDNLELITRRELMLRNTLHRYPKEIASAIQLLGAMRRKINRRSRDEEQDRRPA